ncbi:MAG: hypothetical protein FJX67_12055 [Alphaproteobacteria bacterium]|nr:hypothetical protein [Alphaproteobacteria bacterium]
MIGLAQGIAALAPVASAVLLFRLARRMDLPEPLALAAAAILVLATASLREVANGMEMTLFALLGLVLLERLTASRADRLTAGIAVPIALMMLVRFEAGYFLLAVVLWLWLDGRRRTAVSCLAVAALAFAAIALWRYDTFGQLAPNTAYAKLWPPYQPHDLVHRAQRHVYAALEPAIVLPFLAAAGAVAAAILIRRRRLGDMVAGDARLYFLVAASGVAFGILLGKNDGHAGRMIYATLPAAILVLLAFVHGALARRGARTIALAALVLALAQAPAGLYAAYAHYGRLDGVKPETYRKTGILADRLADALDKPGLVFMTPDIGGVALCCPRHRIVDLALLANRWLAIEGYGALDRQLAVERPDLIGTHASWTLASGIYRTRAIADYVPILTPFDVNAGRVFLLRRDHVETLIARGLARPLAPADAVTLPFQTPDRVFVGAQPRLIRLDARFTEGLSLRIHGFI